MTNILGLDTSCDETSAAVLKNQTVKSNVVSSQIELHQPYGGVFPTVAKLAHQQNIQTVVDLALKRAKVKPQNLQAVAVTLGPGLAPALEVGLNYAKEFALKYHLPLIPINHLEGHLLSPLLQPQTRSKKNIHLEPKFPVLALVISGGHSQFIKVKEIGDYEILGETLDDAAGECLDKIGRLLNLGYPAAPVMEQLAKKGKSQRFPFPLPLTTRHDFMLSFSGLKTYARNLIEKLEKEKALSSQDISDLCAGAQEGVFRHLIYKLDKLLQKSQKEQKPFQALWVGGGVAHNVRFRTLVRKIATQYQLKAYFPYHQRFCGDNAAMIALAATFKFQKKKFYSTEKIITSLERAPNLSWQEKI